MSILDNICSPEDVKKLSERELTELCSEIREFLIRSVSKTGGHLSSNLGVVELTVAIHKVFDTLKDKLVFDVGHQSYVHKILTGRKNGFTGLRQTGGIAGFPRPAESPHDAFIAGHASTSISVALGIAHARTLSRGEYSVIALIGDGALTGGAAFEGLSNAGGFGERLIIILNDNGMSITKNVGGISRYLSRQRMKPSYAKAKKLYRRVMGALPGGRVVYRFTHKVKAMIKGATIDGSMFEEMGLQYSGLIDGHDIGRITEALIWAKNQNGPAIVHVLTKKGKGYKYSEQAPDKYHGVRPFNYETGIKRSHEATFSSVFGDEITRLAGLDPRICAITASMTSGTGLTGFAARFGDRFFDVGIAEGHAVAMAAGMASRGAIPVFAVYSTFLQRSYDMCIHDVAISGLHVVFAVDRAGLVSGDGETHQGVYDAVFLRSIPGITVWCPASFAELRDMLSLAVGADGPVAVRYPRGGEGAYKDGGTESAKCIKEGKDFTIVTYGTNINTAVEAAGMLEEEGVHAEVIKLGCICPVNIEVISGSVARTGRILVLEDCSGRGSVGEGILAALTQNYKTQQTVRSRRYSRAAGTGRTSETAVKRNLKTPKSAILLNVGENFVPCGEIDELRAFCGIDANSVRNAIKEELGFEILPKS